MPALACLTCGSGLDCERAARSGMPGPVGAVLTAKRDAHVCRMPEVRRVFPCRGRGLVSSAPAAEPCPFAVETAPTVLVKRLVWYGRPDREKAARSGLPGPVGAVLTAKRAAHVCRMPEVRRIFPCRGRSLVSNAPTAEPRPFAVETAPTILVKRLTWHGRPEGLRWHAEPCGSGLDRENGRSCLPYS